MFDAVLAYLTDADFLIKAELFLRIIISVLCGGLIGYERTNRGKGAGIRTHIIVAIAACLMMIISQYGFEDFFENYNNPSVDLRHDPSRVAAQIVSGIGFLGAGMIFIQKNVVTGLTTAAGIWATSGIGMAIGCGMYFIGIACTVIVVIVHTILHKKSKLFHAPVEQSLSFVVEDSQESIQRVLDKLESFNIVILEAEYQKIGDNLLKMDILAQCVAFIDKAELMQQLYQESSIESIKI